MKYSGFAKNYLEDIINDSKQIKGGPSGSRLQSKMIPKNLVYHSK